MNRDIALVTSGIVATTGMVVAMVAMGDGVSAASFAILLAILVWGLHCECRDLARRSRIAGVTEMAVSQLRRQVTRMMEDETP